MFKIGSIIILLYFLFNSLYLTVTTQGYGPFNVTIAANDECKGPKRKECCVLTSKILNNITIHYDFNITENVAPIKGKVTAIAKNREMWSFILRDPCNHMIFGPLMHRVLEVSKDCFIRKGHRTLTLDVQEFAQKFRGGTFIFGNLTFKSIFYNDHCNFVCSIMTITLSRSKKK